MSVMEISHRSSTFEGIIARPRRTYARSPTCRPNYKILFLQGGASLQFSMVPMNLLTEGRTADYIMTGSWARKGGQGSAAGRRGEHRGDRPRPTTSTASRRQDECRSTAGAAYVHIRRTTRSRAPSGRRCRPSATCRSSSTRRPTSSAARSTSRSTASIYAGAQKNLGPSGVTLVIVREDLLARPSKSLHTMLNYGVHAENGSLYNTPPAFGVYVLGLVIEWLKAQGGLAGIARGEHAQGGQAVCGARSHRVLRARRAEGQPQPDERHVPRGAPRTSRRSS